MSNLDLDDESDVEIPEVGSEHSSDITSMTSQIDQLRSMKRELDFRGTLLGKTWAELSQLLGKYQADLVTKYDHLESMLGSEGRDQIIKLENNVEHKSRQISELHKTIHDLETRLLEKDGEIVHLRTDVHKLRNEVSIKDNLINKVQTQMAKESMEYTTEINTLKEIISVGEGNMAPLDTVEIRPAPPPQPKRKRRSHGSSSGSATEPGPSSKAKKESVQPSPTIIKLPESVDLAHLPQITLAALPTLSSQIVLTTAPMTGTPTIWPTAPQPTLPEPVEAVSETVKEKESLDLQLDITVEEEPSIKSESDDVMMALEQGEASVEEPGTSGTQKSKTDDPDWSDRSPYGRNCTMCGRYQPTPIALKLHYDTAHPSSDRRCVICLLSDVKKRQRWHEITHFRRGVMDCSACGLRFPTAANFNYHVAMHQSTDINNPDCTLCGEVSFQSAEELKIHTKSHEILFSLDCPDGGGLNVVNTESGRDQRNRRQQTGHKK